MTVYGVTAFRSSDEELEISSLLFSISDEEADQWKRLLALADRLTREESLIAGVVVKQEAVVGQYRIADTSQVVRALGGPDRLHHLRQYIPQVITREEWDSLFHYSGHVVPVEATIWPGEFDLIFDYGPFSGVVRNFPREMIDLAMGEEFFVPLDGGFMATSAIWRNGMAVFSYHQSKERERQYRYEYLPDNIASVVHLPEVS